MSYEWWYYAAFSLLFIGIRELVQKKITSAIYLFLATGILLMRSKLMLAFFAVWLAGAAMYWLVKYVQSRQVKYLPDITGILSILMMATVVYKMGYERNNFGKLAFGIAFAGCIPVMAHWTIANKRPERATVYL